MIWHYLKQAFHRLGRHKVHSLIIVIGLTIGMSSALLILFYCQFERSYDDFHRQADRIFRVQNDQVGPTQTIGSAGCPPALAPALKHEFPEIVDFTRVLKVGGDTNIVARTLGDGRTLSGYEPHVFFAESALLRMFSFPLVEGDDPSALDRPESVVMTQSAARRYFGDEDSLGQTVTVTTTFGTQDYLVTGVCRDIPVNSHFRFDILLSYGRLKSLWPFNENNPWRCHAFLTYLLLSPDADRSALEEKSTRLINANFPLSDSSRTELTLQPLGDIHLTSRLHQEADVNGDYRVVALLEWIAVLILLTAWANTINLATARSMEQGREVGVRKTLGAGRSHILAQFLADALLLNLLAFVLSLAVIHAILVPFGRLVGKPLWTVQLGVGWLWVTAVILVGDSSCLMDVSAEDLTRHLGQSALNLGLLSYLDLPSFGILVRNCAHANPERLETVVLLLHPESLRLQTPSAYHRAQLEDYLAGRDARATVGIAGRLQTALGANLARGRLVARLIPTPLSGVYGRFYGFTHDFSRWLRAHRGSAIDPQRFDRTKAQGNAEYRLAQRLESESRLFRQCVPSGVRLVVGLTPVPRSFVGPDHEATCARILE